jgi:hypothetical protein
VSVCLAAAFFCQSDIIGICKNGRKTPLLLSLGMNGRPEQSRQSWRSGGKSGIIWLWPDTGKGEFLKVLTVPVIGYMYAHEERGEDLLANMSKKMPGYSRFMFGMR